jgi:excisionase family DNA binding protein
MSTIDPRPKSAPDLLTVHEVAERLRVSYGTVYGLLRDGSLPAVKVGSQWRVDSERLNLFLSERVSVMEEG